jgi:UDP-N-acetylglucosamine:LPS N-acetylglucosamine transferase
MPNRSNILILTALTGGGHLSLAEALRDLLEQEFAITIVNLLPGLFEVSYRFAGHYALWLWSMTFHLSDSSGQARSVQRLLVPLIDSRLKRALDQVQPDLVITTHPLLSHAARRVLEKYAPRTPFVLLLSDPYSIHATWFSERNAAATLAPTRASRELALANGFDPGHVHLVGWPVRGQFYRTGGLSRAETLTRLGLDPDRFTIFLQGGGDGAANFWRSAERLLALDQRVQVILATGMNRALLRRFRGVKNLYALPFTREITPYMSAADIVMGKAGPNVLFEAVVLGKPFIATTFIPGQEKGNLEFIARYGIGQVALKMGQQRELIRRLVMDDALADALAVKIKEYRQWNSDANATILPVIRGLVPGK